MQLIACWILFPLVLAALGAGWGVLVEKALGRPLPGVLLLPLGLMAALIAAAMLTASDVTARAAVPVVGVLGAVGLVVALPVKRITPWPLLAAVAVLLVYGAPVFLSGDPTFAGYIKLDDTATWLGITDQMFAHSRTITLTPPSTFGHNVEGYLALTGYPVGAFMLLGVGHGLVGVDAAWLFQPYVACCGALVALGMYALFERLIPSAPLRAGVAFVAAQPALLFAYSLWGGIKELTAAWLVVAGAALLAPHVGRGAPRPREVLPLAIAGAALAITLGPAAALWLGPAIVVIALSWGWVARRDGGLRSLLASGATLAATTAALAFPALLVAATFLATDGVLTVEPTGEARDVNALGNLVKPLSVFQAAGIWPIGDFRLVAPTAPTSILAGLVLVCALGALIVCVRRRQPALVLYVAVVLAGALAIKLGGGSPWAVGKTLTIASPALLAAGLYGAVLLLERSRLAGAVTCAVIAAGVLWSNALAYHQVQLAPYARLAELKDVGGMLAGKGPTFLNEFEVYGTRHFLRAGHPIAPAEYRPVPLALRGGERLGPAAFADLDAFPAETLLNYRTIVTRASPTQSRPPSQYRLAWQGRWYQVWQRPATPPDELVRHIPGGDSNTLPYCGTSDRDTRLPCSIAPAAVPPCSVVRRAGALAAREKGRLVAYERPEPIVARATQGRIPVGWKTDLNLGRVSPSRPGTMYLRFHMTVTQRYRIWLGGSFGRGFEVTVDGRRVGRISDRRQSFGSYERMGSLVLARGIRTFALTYPRANSLAPGSGAALDTSLLEVALEPLDHKQARMLDVAPSAAHSLCGRSLDWIEVVKPAT